MSAMSERMPIERSATPNRQRSPYQNPTPTTPERQGRPTLPDPGTGAESQELDWTDFSPDHIDALSEEVAKKTLKIAMRKLRSLEDDMRTSKMQAAHHRFNNQMLLGEQKERSKRSEVEFQLLSSSQDLLYNKLSRSEDEERTFRNRHLKAKKRVAELTEDNRRQQLSIEHLKQAISSGSSFGLSSRTSSSGHQMDGGLEVLSDAAGMAQKRDLDQSQHHSSTRLQAGQLLSPVAFEPIPLPHLPDRSSKRRRESAESLVSEKSRGVSDAVPSSGRRSTFNSSGNLTQLSDRITPITPKSPARTKLVSSD